MVLTVPECLRVFEISLQFRLGLQLDIWMHLGSPSQSKHGSREVLSSIHGPKCQVPQKCPLTVVSLRMQCQYRDVYSWCGMQYVEEQIKLSSNKKMVCRNWHSSSLQIQTTWRHMGVRISKALSHEQGPCWNAYVNSLGRRDSLKEEHSRLVQDSTMSRFLDPSSSKGQLPFSWYSTCAWPHLGTPQTPWSRCRAGWWELYLWSWNREWWLFTMSNDMIYM